MFLLDIISIRNCSSCLKTLHHRRDNYRPPPPLPRLWTGTTQLLLFLLTDAVRGGNHWKTSQKKQDRPIQTDRQLLLLSPPIWLVPIMPLICFFDGTKSEMIVINCLPYQLIKTEVEGYWTEPCN